MIMRYFILIENVKKDKFKIKINKHLRIEPVKILIPDAYILPYALLENEKVMKKLNKLGDQGFIAEEDITFMPDPEL